MSKIQSHDVLESLCKMRIRESHQLKTVVELYEMEIHQKISMSNYQKLKTMVKRCERVVYRHKAILLIVCECSGVHPRRFRRHGS